MEDPKCKIKLFFENFQEMFSDGSLSDFRKTNFQQSISQVIHIKISITRLISLLLWVNPYF